MRGFSVLELLIALVVMAIPGSTAMSLHGDDPFSLFADADTRPTLNALTSRDDIVQASDGGFVGLAEEF